MQQVSVPEVDPWPCPLRGETLTSCGSPAKSNLDTKDQSFHAKAFYHPSLCNMMSDEASIPALSESPLLGPAHVVCADMPSLGPFRSRPRTYSTDSDEPTFKRPKLTLSAFRRPEQTIRLTRSDPNRKLLEEYDLHAPGCGVLGHGAFSTVRLAVKRCNGVQVAVKTIAKHDALRSRRLRVGGRRYLEEWEILRRMQSEPYIISLLDVFETDEEIQLVMEYCSGGELFNAIQKKKNRAHGMRRGQYLEAQAAQITGQILQALVALHAQGIVHRDVKAENILIYSSALHRSTGGGTMEGDDESYLHVKLCDFGSARALIRESEFGGSVGDASPITPCISRSYSIVGSNYYMAPEVGEGEYYSTAIDVYSLGVTLYILLCGFPPVFAGNENDSEVLFPAMYWKEISEDAKALVKRMLNPKPLTRITAAEALADPWIATHSALHRNEVNNRAGLDLLRSSLIKNLSDHQTPSARPPRRHLRRASSCLMALADLYRGVAPSSSMPPPPVVVASDDRSDVCLEPGGSFEDPRRPSVLPALSV